MATTLSVAALLLAISWRRSEIMTAAHINDGLCEKITIPLCTGMRYNMTRMPNLVGISNQNEAALQVRRSLSLAVHTHRSLPCRVAGLYLSWGIGG